MRVLTALCASLVLGVTAAPAAGQQNYDRDAALALSQGAIGAAVGDHTLRDTRGQPFHLRNLRGKPLIISLIYTSCHHVCPLITRNVAEKVEIAREALGDDAFTVKTYASSQGIDMPGWHFLSGDAATVTALSDDLGFQFFPSAKGFDHLSQTTIVDAAGAVYRQIYGVDFDTQAFVEPLKELVFDTPREAGFAAHWIDTFRLFCTVYDPNSGRYEFDYSIFMTILVGTLCLGSILVFIVREWRHSR
jgi:protein SCO1/2